MATAPTQTASPQTASPPPDPPIPTAEGTTTSALPTDALSTSIATASPSAALPELRGSTVYVIDANSLIFQVFHALPEMTSPRGESVGAVYGFTRDIVFLLESKPSDYLIAAFDMSGPTFRHELYDRYKADRAEMPEDLRPQVLKIRRVLEAFGIPIIEQPGFEADDIMATLATLGDAEGFRCLLVTNDKDCRQLISEQVSLYNVRKDEIYDAASLLRDWGIRPDQVVDFQALVGDPVDCVPGVALIGPKAAQELLGTYGTLDEVLAHAGEVKGAKKRENLLAGRDVALLSRKLVELDRRVPIEVDWNNARSGRIDPQKLAELMAEFGFRGLAEKVGTLKPLQAASGADVISTAVESPAATIWEHDYKIVDTPEKLADLIARMGEQELISLDTETTHVSPRWAEIVGYSFAWKPGEAYYVPVLSPDPVRRLDPHTTLEALRPILENPRIAKVGQNLKYDMIVLRNVGVELAGLAFDTMVASYLIDAGQRSHSMDELAKRYLDHTPMPITALIGSGKDQKRMDEVAVDQIGWYAAEDADVPLRLQPILAQNMQQAELTELFETLELPLVEVLVELEYNGIRVDLDRLRQLSDQYGARLVELEREIYTLAGREFNIGSPKQLAQVLFVEHKLPVLRKSKTGPSTDVEVLTELAQSHPLPAKIIEYRQFAKLKNTYVDALPALVNPATGRVHTSFNQGVAATGRLSSSDPNLQNIPVRNESGREIRSAFLPAEGWKLLAADYSQIELRVLAHFSEDPELLRAFDNNEDIHALVASQVHGVPLAEVTSAMRRVAKAVNFGVVYGQSPFGLAALLGIEQQQAAEFIDGYFRRYARVEKFLSETLEICLRDGYVRTILGRRRAIEGIRSSAGRQRNLPERTAINTVIQGSAADLIKLAMLKIHRRLRTEKFPSRMLLQIHDELIFEVPPEHLDRLAKLVAEEMAAAYPLRVPLKVDLKVGDTWADCESWS